MMKNKFWPLLCAIGALLCLGGCGSSLYAEPSGDYSKIDAVPGVEFYVPSFVTSKATAITDIIATNEYSREDTFVCKNGEDSYTLFNMDNIVICVKKGTSFGVTDDNKNISSVENKGYDRVWIDDVEQLVFKDEKYIANVNSAQVKITNYLYGAYSGGLTSIQTRSDEYSLFIGIPTEKKKYEDLSKEQIAVIKAVTRSFRALQADEEDAVAIEAEEDPPIALPEDMSNELKEETKTEYIRQDTEEELPVEETTPTKDESVAQNMQENVFESDPYHMLGIGQKGMYHIFSGNGAVVSYIKIESVLHEKEIESIIREYCETDNALYDYPKAQEGCHWEGIKYSTVADPEVYYTDIRFCGMDGESLKFRGIEYSQRTHDILIFAQKRGAEYTDLYCFYNVPNGCKEYALKVGETINGTQDAGLLNAYFKIN